MSKSSTVTVRETPVTEVASETAGGLTIHGETFVVGTDHRVELVDLTDRIMGLVRRLRIREESSASGRCTRPARSSSTSVRPRCCPTSSAFSSRWWPGMPSGCTTIPRTRIVIA